MSGRINAASAETLDWPADAPAIRQGQQFLDACAGTRTVVACDSDVDGLVSAVIVERALRDRGADVVVLPVRRGEHVHRDSMRTRIRAARAARLVVLDMGSRPEPIIDGLPTLIIDHHHAAGGTPPGAVVVNGYDREPVATSSVLAYVVASGDAEVAWLAALGAVADLGTAASFDALLGLKAAGTAWTKAVSLLNAARRAADPEPEVAFRLLGKAATVKEVTSAHHPETAVLERKQQEVRAETERCARIAPHVLGEVALIRLTSAAQVHPLVAVRWTRRLAGRIVIAANDGYLPDRVNFAIRAAHDVDLIEWLRRLPFVPTEPGEFANGHRRATGGSLTPADFARFVEVLR